MINELDTVALLHAIPEYGLEVGDIGAIVHVYGTGEAYEVEFVSGDGYTVAVVTLDAHNVRPMLRNEILHVRALQPA